MSALRFVCAACACLTATTTASRAVPPSPPTARAAAAASLREMPPDAPFLKALEQFKGERVMIPLRNLDAYQERPVAPAEKLLGRLQNFCEAYTPKDKGDKPAMIPFGVRGTWVIAPETQVIINYDYRFTDPKSARSRREALTDALLAMPPETFLMVGSDQGTPIAGLPEAVRESLLQALAPPCRVDLPENPSAGPTQVVAKEITTPIDPKTVRFRMRLRAGGAFVQDERGRRTRLVLPSDAVEPQVATLSLYGDPTHSTLETVKRVPNKYKPGDLDGARFTQPLGLHGMQNVSSILQQVEKVTGLKAYASEPWAFVMVYVGSDAITCGEALDGLRLILTGSWRKVGSVYVLAYEHDGIRSAQRRWNAAASRILYSGTREGFDPYNARWLVIAGGLPFAADDPLRWSDEQRRALFGDVAIDPKRPAIQRPNVAFAQMTAAQQAQVRRMAPADESVPRDGTHPPAYRPFTANEIDRAVLEPRVMLEIDVALPEFGWVRVPDPSNVQYEASLLDSIRRIAHDRTAGTLTNQPGLRFFAPPWGLEAGDPAASERAVMTAAVPPSRLPGMARSLKALGVTTLIYPLLYNGYATLPGTPFPLDPALKGANGWAAAVKAGRAAGLRVLGSVNVLEWRASPAPHWLDRRQDLVDVDDMGQSRLQWLAGQKPTKLDYRVRLAVGDLVRVRSTEAQTWVRALLSAAAKTPGASGVVFDKWRESPNLNRIGLGYLPQLGFAPADRLSSILEDGIDPVDEPLQIVSFRLDLENVPRDGEPGTPGIRRPASAAIGGTGAVSWRIGRPTGPVRLVPPATPDDAEDALMKGLLEYARKLDSNWKAYVVEEGALAWPSPMATPSPQSDGTLYTGDDATSIRQRRSPRLLIRIPAPQRVKQDPLVPPPARSWPGIGVAVAEVLRPSFTASRQPFAYSLLVYDFRAASEDPVTSLKWLKDQPARAAKTKDEYMREWRESHPPSGSPKG